MLSPTDYCNLNCKICWRRRKNATFAQPSFEFLSKILKEAGEMKVEIVDLTGGGEPFIRKDIIQIMRLVKRYGMKGTITTNSTLIKKYDVEKIVEMKWDEIKFSLDGSSPKVNDYIRGKGTFNKVLKCIKMFQEVKKKNSSPYPSLRLCFTITKTNLTDIPNYIKLAKKLRINDISFSTLFEWESNKEFWLEKNKKKGLIKILKKGLEISKKEGVKTNLEPIIKFGIWDHPEPKFCFAPWYMLFINARREAMMCCTLASLYQNKLGKVKSLKEIWFGKKMEMLREMMKKKIFFKECKRCLPDFTQLFNELYEKVERWNLKK
jgi:MoaA/NifB/PqqE/SkfB family radical SAM enzyme